MSVKVLVVDVGGSHIKLLASGHRLVRKLPSGPTLTPTEMVEQVLAAVSDWSYEVVSVGYPGPVSNNRPSKDPVNLGPGWKDFDFAKAFGCKVRVINDAAMQALGSYTGGSMLFLGLGTGLGTALVREDCVVPLELAHLPYRRGRSFEDYVGETGMEKLGRRKWRRHVEKVCAMLMAAVNADYVVLGGGNVQKIKSLPPGAQRGSNAHAFRGGYRLWKKSGRSA